MKPCFITLLILAALILVCARSIDPIGSQTWNIELCTSILIFEICVDANGCFIYTSSSSLFSFPSPRRSLIVSIPCLYSLEAHKSHCPPRQPQDAVCLLARDLGLASPQQSCCFGPVRNYSRWRCNLPGYQSQWGGSVLKHSVWHVYRRRASFQSASTSCASPWEYHLRGLVWAGLSSGLGRLGSALVFDKRHSDFGRLLES